MLFGGCACNNANSNAVSAAPATALHDGTDAQSTCLHQTRRYIPASATRSGVHRPDNGDPTHRMPSADCEDFSVICGARLAIPCSLIYVSQTLLPGMVLYPRRVAAFLPRYAALNKSVRAISILNLRFKRKYSSFVLRKLRSEVPEILPQLSAEGTYHGGKPAAGPGLIKNQLGRNDRRSRSGLDVHQHVGHAGVVLLDCRLYSMRDLVAACSRRRKIDVIIQAHLARMAFHLDNTGDRAGNGANGPNNLSTGAVSMIS
jgi:hypothetical protein